MDMSKYPYVSPRTVFEGKDCVPKDDPGMSLLDFYAGQALPVILENHVKRNAEQINPFTVGMLSYAVALGMLAAREQPEEAFQPKETEPVQEVTPKETP